MSGWAQDENTGRNALPTSRSVAQSILIKPFITETGLPMPNDEISLIGWLNPKAVFSKQLQMEYAVRCGESGSTVPLLYHDTCTRLHMQMEKRFNEAIGQMRTDSSYSIQIIRALENYRERKEHNDFSSAATALVEELRQNALDVPEDTLRYLQRFADLSRPLDHSNEILSQYEPQEIYKLLEAAAESRLPKEDWHRRDMIGVFEAIATQLQGLIAAAHFVEMEKAPIPQLESAQTQFATLQHALEREIGPPELNP